MLKQTARLRRTGVHNITFLSNGSSSCVCLQVFIVSHDVNTHHLLKLLLTNRIWFTFAEPSAFLWRLVVVCSAAVNAISLTSLVQTWRQCTVESLVSEKRSPTRNACLNVQCLWVKTACFRVCLFSSVISLWNQ